jgi:MGT family glycosyltransferase
MKTIAVFCMPLRGHFQRMKVVVAGLAKMGHAVHVFTAAAFRDEVERAGARFVDLGRYPLDAADSDSYPISCRFVSFAATYAEQLLDDLGRLAPSVIVYDSFAVIGLVLGRLSGIPYVCVCAGGQHAASVPNPPLDGRPRVISGACHEAVERLKALGIAEATPFLYLGGKSPYLNLYCETAAFLEGEDRAALEPIAIVGSVSPDPVTESMSPSGTRRVYVSFGTVVWRYFSAQALAALETLAGVFEALPVKVAVGLGGTAIGAAARARIQRPNVQIESYIDQWRVLSQSDVFITHHGLNSTHEAIYHGVPMISYPFFADQPKRAEKCRALGLAVPLVSEVRGRVSPGDVRAALEWVEAAGEALAQRFAEARVWEEQAIAARGAVFEKIAALSEPPHG